MDLSNIVCSILVPFDMRELVLSFLLIPGNHLEHEYLCVWRDLCSEFRMDTLFVRTLSFLNIWCKAILIWWLTYLGLIFPTCYLQLFTYLFKFTCTGASSPWLIWLYIKSTTSRKTVLQCHPTLKKWDSPHIGNSMILALTYQKEKQRNQIYK